MPSNTSTPNVEATEDAYHTDNDKLQQELSEALVQLRSFSPTIINRPATSKRRRLSAGRGRGRGARGSKLSSSLRTTPRSRLRVSPAGSAQGDTVGPSTGTISLSGIACTSMQNEEPPRDEFARRILEGIDNMNKKFDLLLSRVEDLIPRVKHLEDENTSLKKKMALDETRIIGLENRLDDLEQATRDKHLLISSPEIDFASSDLISSTVDLISSKLHISKDLFIGTKAQKFGSKGTTVLLTLNNPTLRPTLFKNVRKVKPDNLYINEFLIKKRENIYRQLREKKKMDNKLFFSVFTFHGKIYLKKYKTSDKILIQSVGDAEKLFNKANDPLYVQS